MNRYESMTVITLPRIPRFLATTLVAFAVFQLSACQGDTNDGSGSQQLVLRSHPEAEVFIIKGRSAELKCTAISAVQILFKCASGWILPENHVNQHVTNPATGERYLETSIEVTKDNVDAYQQLHPYGEYWCECSAFVSVASAGQNSPLQQTSPRTVIIVAYLRKRFEREPLSVSVEENEQLQLQCLPPEGKPLPSVFWLKNGVKIDTLSDVHLIISSEGNLIFTQARLSDTGNYTCGAENVATKKLSESAKLTVKVHGGWSAWTAWNDCSVSCGEGEQMRKRYCNNPAPVNNGRRCFGDSIERRPCEEICGVDGGWSPWTDWSECKGNCRRYRYRSCNNPRPQNEGRTCAVNGLGSGDVEHENCTGGECDVALIDRRNELKTNVQEVQTENTVLYVGVIVGIIVFFVVIACLLLLIYRRNKRHESSRKPYKPKSNGSMLGQPDLTAYTFANQKAIKPNNNIPLYSSQNGTLASNGLYGSVGIHENYPYPNGGLMPNGSFHRTLDREHIYSNIDTLEKPAKPNGLQQSELPSYSNINPQPGGQGQHSGQHSGQSSLANSVYSSRLSSVSNQLPSNLDTNALAVAMVTHQGGRLSLPESGVSLTVPEGALAKGTSTEIFLAVCRDDKDRPQLADCQTVLGPVVLLGPRDLSLLKPLILTFQHCASVKHGQWLLSLYNSNTPTEEQPCWQCATVLGQETINTPVYTQLDLNHCHVMSEALGRFVLVGEPAMGGKAVKILRLAVFVATAASDCNLRVYFLEDTQDALQAVVQEESMLGGVMLDKPKQMFFQFGGGNLCLNVEDLAVSWRCKLGANYQEIPFPHIWSSQQSCLHCSFTLENVDRCQSPVTCRIQIYQRDQPLNSQVLQVLCNLSQSTPSTPSPCMLLGQPTGPPSLCQSTVTSSGKGTMALLQPHQAVFRLPSEVRQELCHILDPPTVRCNDWRMLAQRLSVDRYVNYFATKPSPTEHILDLWEARHREESAIVDLMNTLRVMGRQDAASVLEQHFTAWL